MRVIIAASLLVWSPGCLTHHVIGEHPEWRKLVATPGDLGLSAELVRFPSQDGISLSAWWIPATTGHHASIVLAHGQGANQSYMLGQAAFLVAAGYNVLALDLRAHGDSEGDYVTPGYKEAEDVLAAVAYLRRENHGRTIILFGYSYGAVAALLAAKQDSDLTGVIADAPFISAVGVLHRIADYVRLDRQQPFLNKLGMSLLKWPLVLGLVRIEFWMRTGVWLAPKRTDAIHAARSIAIPILFIAGEKDPISPAKNIVKMYEACPSSQKKLVVLPDAAHWTYSGTNRKQYEEAVVDFLKTIELRIGVHTETPRMRILRNKTDSAHRVECGCGAVCMEFPVRRGAINDGF